jgi:hypothetical protein
MPKRDDCKADLRHRSQQQAASALRHPRGNFALPKLRQAKSNARIDFITLHVFRTAALGAARSQSILCGAGRLTIRHEEK